MRTIGVRLRMETGAYVADTKAATDATAKLRGSISDTATKSKADWDAIANGAAIAGAALVGIAGAAVHAAMQFDKQMSEVGAVANATADEMAQLRQAALDAGAATVFSATEAAQAQAELAKAGLTTADILSGALDGALALASAGTLDLATAAEISANAMNTFGLEGKDVTHIADVLAAASNKSAAGVQDLGQGLQQVGLIANQVGFSLEETVGVLAAFADRGLKGSDGATSLKTALMRLASPTDKAAAMLEELGVSLYDANGQMIGAADIAGQLQAGLQDLAPAGRNAAMQIIFGSDAIRAANILYAEGQQGIQGYIDAVNDQGAASEVAAKKLDNLAGDVEALTGSLETLAIGGGSGASSGLRFLVQGATDLVNSLSALPGPVQSGIIVITGLSGVALLAGAAMIKLRKTTSELMENLAASGPAGSKFATGISRVAVFAGKATAALTALQLASSAFGDAPLNARVESMSDSLSEFGATGTKAGEAARVLGKDFEHLAYDLGTLDSGFWADMGNGIAGTVEGLTGLGNVFDESLVHAKERLDAIDAGLANLVNTGRPAQAAMAFQRLADAAKAQGVSVEDLTRALPGYASAMDQAAKKTDEQGKAAGDAVGPTQELAGAMGDAAMEADALTTEWEQLNGATLSADQAMLEAKKTVDAVGDAFAANGDKIKGNSKAALENRIALATAGQAASNAAQQYLDMTGDVEGAVDIMEDQKQAAIDAAVANGGNRKSVEKLADALFDLPKAVKTRVEVAGAAAGKQMVDALKRSIDNIYSKTVHINAVVSTTGKIAIPNALGGVYEPAAVGKLRQADVFTPASPGRYMIAEPTTGGEAFVPKRGNYGRSMSILSAAAGWYNADVVPRGGWYGAGGGGMAGGQVQVVLPPGGTPFERALVEVLRGLSWSVGGGSAQKSYGRGGR